MIYLYLATPLLGLIRNYVKYKQLNYLYFIRTPLIYYLINFFSPKNTIWMTLIQERWFFFLYKTILSLYRNDYYKKREKYIKKYGLIYNIDK